MSFLVWLSLFQFPLLGAVVCIGAVAVMYCQKLLYDLSGLFPELTPTQARLELYRVLQSRWGGLLTHLTFYGCIVFVGFSFIGGYL